MFPCTQSHPCSKELKLQPVIINLTGQQRHISTVRVTCPVLLDELLSLSPTSNSSRQQPGSNRSSSWLQQGELIFRGNFTSICPKADLPLFLLSCFRLTLCVRAHVCLCEYPACLLHVVESDECVIIICMQLC